MDPGESRHIGVVCGDFQEHVAALVSDFEMLENAVALERMNGFQLTALLAQGYPNHIPGRRVSPFKKSQ
jgi:hypothetical protein